MGAQGTWRVLLRGAQGTVENLLQFLLYAGQSSFFLAEIAELLFCPCTIWCVQERTTSAVALIRGSALRRSAGRHNRLVEQGTSELGYRTWRGLGAKSAQVTCWVAWRRPLRARPLAWPSLRGGFRRGSRSSVLGILDAGAKWAQSALRQSSGRLARPSRPFLPCRGAL